jgi:dipeptidyl aminopeptidase/acylaminoacyl peptidase
MAGVVGLSSPVDLEPRPDGGGFGDALLHGRGADAFARDPAVLRDASPLRHVSAALLPALLVVGDHDFPMLEADARAFAARAAAAGRTIPVVVAKDRDHMAVVAGLAERESDVLDAVVAFLRR